MGEVRDKRARLALLTGDREAASVPQQAESAGEQLIKQLVKKQTNAQTTLQEQLLVRQNFVSASKDGETSTSSSAGNNTDLSIEELKKKTGLSRQQLESSLAEKPNSAVSKLYRFALSNQAGLNTQCSLISNLPDHPLNHLKALEEDFMSYIGKAKLTQERKKRKHRKRRKKVAVEQTCEPRPVGLSKDCLDNEGSDDGNLDFESMAKTSVESESLLPDGPNNSELEGVLRNVDKAGCSPDSSGGESSGRRKRPSLWDVRNVETMEKHLVTCREPKLFTIRDGTIVEVTKSAKSGENT